MFDFLKKIFKGDESKKTDSKPVKKTTKPKTEPKKITVTKSKTVKKESNKQPAKIKVNQPRFVLYKYWCCLRCSTVVERRKAVTTARPRDR